MLDSTFSTRQIHVQGDQLILTALGIFEKVNQVIFSFSRFFEVPEKLYEGFYGLYSEVKEFYIFANNFRGTCEL